MSVQALSAVLEHSQMRYGPRLVMISIANHANDLGEHAYPNLETLGREACLSVRQVIRCVQSCEDGGELTVERESNKPNRYRILLPGLGDDNTSRESTSNKDLLLTTKYLGSRDISGPHMSRDKMSPQKQNGSNPPKRRPFFTDGRQVPASSDVLPQAGGGDGYIAWDPTDEHGNGKWLEVVWQESA